MHSRTPSDAATVQDAWGAGGESLHPAMAAANGIEKNKEIRGSLENGMELSSR
jgi:hypothetical protein